MTNPLSTFAFTFVTLLVSAADPTQRWAATNTSERIFEVLRIREGSTVCEIGAGDGTMSIAAAKRVGSAGRVYTSELGEVRLKALQMAIANSALAQIVVVSGDAAKTNFPDAGCDAIFMRDVYHHLTNPASMNASILASLKPGARLAVVDFTPPPGNEASHPADRAKDGMHGICPESLSRELQDAGFLPVMSDIADDRWFMVVVTKPGRQP